MLTQLISTNAPHEHQKSQLLPTFPQHHLVTTLLVRPLDEHYPIGLPRISPVQFEFLTGGMFHPEQDEDTPLDWPGLFAQVDENEKEEADQPTFSDQLPLVLTRGCHVAGGVAWQ